MFDVNRTNIEITATDRTKAAFDSVKSSIGTLTSQFGALAGILGAGAFAAMTKGIIDQADSMNDLSKRTGIAVEQLGAWRLATEQSGTSMDALANALGKGSKYMVEHAENLKKIGINAKTSQELLLQMSGIISRMPSDDPRRMALAMEVFGKSAGDLLPLLSEGEEGLRKMLERGTELNSITSDLASNADVFNDQLAEMKMLSGGLFVDLVSKILPSLNVYLAQIKAIVSEGDWFDKLLFFTVGYVPAKIADKTNDPVERIKQYDEGIKKLKATIDSMGGPNKPLTANLVDQLNTAEKARASLLDKVQKKNAAGMTTPAIYDATAMDAFLKGNKSTAESDAKKIADAVKRKNADILKAAQDAVDEEFESQQAVSEFKQKKADEFQDYQLKLKKALEDKDQEILERINRAENKMIDDRNRKQMEAVEKLARQQEQMAKELSQAFTNGLFDSFKKGESFGKAMIRNLASLAQTWFARMLDTLVTSGTGGVMSMVSGITGMFSGNASAQTGSKSILGTLSSIKDFLGGGNNFIVGAIEKLGGIIANGNGGLLDTIGGFLGTNASAISNGFGYLGAGLQALKGNFAGAALSAVGTYFGGPIGGAIGGAIGSLFGGSTPKRNWARVDSSYANGKFNVDYAEAVRKGGPVIDPLTNLEKAFSTQLGSFLDAFGVSDEHNLAAHFSTRPGKKTKASFTGNINGQYIHSGDMVYGKKDSQAWQKFVDMALGDVMARFVKASALSDGVKKFFDGLTDKTAIADAMQSLVGLNAALKDLPPVFNQIKNAIDTTAYTTSLADLKTLFSNTQTYTSLFYTQQENFDTFTKQLTSQFTALNAALPDTRDGFRSLVDGLMNDFSESGRKQFAGLVALSGAADQYYKQLEAQKQSLEEQKRVLDSINSFGMERFTSLAEYRAARGVSNNYGATFALDYTANRRTGAITNGANGQASAGGNTDLVTLLKELRDIAKQTLKQNQDTATKLDKFDRIGMAARA